MSEILRVRKLSDRAYIPTRGSNQSAGWDLYSAYNYALKAKDKIIVSTDLSIQLPLGTYGRIAGRSGFATNYTTKE